jgi:hypothetical protein
MTRIGGMIDQPGRQPAAGLTSDDCIRARRISFVEQIIQSFR